MNGHLHPSDRPALVPAAYREDFSAGEVRGWASYPPAQDTAYDPYLYPGRIRPADPVPCLVAVCQPHWNVEQRLGAVKLLDMALDSAFALRFRFHVKSIVPCERIEVHFPTVDAGRLVRSIDRPETNRWIDAAVGWYDLAAQNPALSETETVRITALAVQAVVPDADPDIPIHLGLAAFVLEAKRTARFVFASPRTAFLGEWGVHVPLRTFRAGETLAIAGTFECPVESADIRIAPPGIPESPVFEGSLEPSGDGWKADVPVGSFPAGMYLGTVTGRGDGRVLARSAFTAVRLPDALPGHPRLLFDSAGRDTAAERLRSDRFRAVRERFETESRALRDKVGIETRVYDFDQFPDRDWIASLWNWFIDRMILFREALFTNAVAYSLLDDSEAGEFCRRFLLLLSEWPQWNHPWMENRGFHAYFPMAEFAGAFALAYDCAYGLLTPAERCRVRHALFGKFVRPAFQTYVEWNQITSQTSNWIAHIAGAALECLAAVEGDDPAGDCPEPMLSGFLLKERRFVDATFRPDGSYGEGYRYYSFAMQSLSRTIPAVERTYGIDLSGPVRTSYLETLWAGIVRKNIAFTFGDSERHLKKEAQAYWIGGQAGPFNSWAWLLSRTRDPHLSWLYHHVKEFDTLQEVLHETGDIPRAEPDDLGGVKFFPSVGTAVFRSGWKEDDFVFVFRSGPFFNHQHMDQGSFALADHGTVFLEERYDGEHHYYDDPLYRSHTIRTVSHNTILVDRNPQSQKTGDPAGFAEGMNESASFAARLDAPGFAFAAGELAGVYGGTLRRLRRNILFLKPRAVLIVDEIVPAGRPVEANLLFHTRRKRDIVLEPGYTRFRDGAPALFMHHLVPERPLREIIADPHFLCQYAEPNLVERGCLMVSAEVPPEGAVFAHLLAATSDGSGPDARLSRTVGAVHAGCRTGGNVLSVAVRTGETTLISGGWETDALFTATTGDAAEVFCAGGRFLIRKGIPIVRATVPFAADAAPEGERTAVRFFLETPGVFRFGPGVRPERVVSDEGGVAAVRRCGDGGWEAALPAGGGIAHLVPE